MRCGFSGAQVLYSDQAATLKYKIALATCFFATLSVLLGSSCPGAGVTDHGELTLQ